MMKTKHLFFVFIPAILIVGIIFALRVVQYEPLYPDFEAIAKNKSGEAIDIPIFPEDPILGYAKATKARSIIVFEDFGCPACAEQMQIFDTLMQKYPKKIKIVWKGLSVTRVPYSSEDAHIYGFCAHEQRLFPAFEKEIFANGGSLSQEALNTAVEATGLKKEALAECLASNRPRTYIENTKIIAEALGIQSVPAVFINNTQVIPPQFIEGWETLLGL